MTQTKFKAQTQPKPFRPKRIPRWLAALPAGEYTLTDLSKQTGRQKSSIQRTLQNLGLEKRYGNLSYRNVTQVLYIWTGLVN